MIVFASSWRMNDYHLNEITRIMTKHNLMCIWVLFLRHIANIYVVDL